MSTSAEIQAVYEGDIARMTEAVCRARGVGVLCDGWWDMRVQDIYPRLKELNEIWEAEDRMQFENTPGEYPCL